MHFVVKNIVSGGIIATYHCSIHCKHCRHNASKSSKKEFISEEMLAKILEKLETVGCKSVHLEGGEPFLFPEKLIGAVKQIHESKIQLEYVVTNCSWYKNQKDAVAYLKRLREAGVQRLLLKTGPFQNESIPLRKVQKVQQAAQKAEINTLLWDIEFYPDMAALDPTKTHSQKQYEKIYGEDYFKKLALQFPINFAGRSFAAYEKFFEKKSVEKLLDTKKTCLSEFFQPHHFHVDLKGNFIFSHTQGITINIDDVGKKIPEGKYKILDILWRGGVNELLDFAKKEYHFENKESYLSKCHLCYDIRTFLVKNKKIDAQDLKPTEFYLHS